MPWVGFGVSSILLLAYTGPRPTAAFTTAVFRHRTISSDDNHVTTLTVPPCRA